MWKFPLSILLALVAAAFPITGASADPGTHSELTAIAGQGAGRVELAPTALAPAGRG
jgi:hypothetical protein